MPTVTCHSLARLTLGLVVVVSLSLVPTQILAVSPSPVASPKASPLASPKTSPTPIPSPSPVASPTAAMTENLQQRIKNILQSTIDKVKTTSHGYIGQVLRVTAETVTIQSKKGSQIISLTPDVSLVKKGKAITVDDISVGDWAMVIGKQQDDAFAPELISISTVSLEPTEHLIGLGKISAITKTGFNFVALNKTDTQQIVYTKTSQILDNQGNPLTYKQLPDQAQVVLVAIKTDTGWGLQELRLTSAIPPSPSPSPKTVTKTSVPKPTVTP